MPFEKHTPGPWRVDAERYQGDLVVIVDASALTEIAEVYTSIPEGPANAPLLAAAPDLYAALKAAESALAIAASYRDDHKALMQVTLDNSRDVLAKARGTP